MRCEEAEVAPVVMISVNSKTGTIVIEDNGPGIPAETIRADLRLHDPGLFARGLREPVHEALKATR